MKGVEARGIGPADGPVVDATRAYQQMEAAFLRQLMAASGAFKPADIAGGQLRADMFIEALADAVAKGGGIGIARMLQDSIGDGGAAGARVAAKGGARPMLMNGATGDTLSPDLINEAEAPDRPEPVRARSGPPAGPPKEISSGFGRRVDPIDGHDKFHQGVDLRAASGDPIRVAGDGVVRRAGPRGGYGNAVEIDHGGGVTTLYAHASEVLVKPGEKVNAQQEIARVGQSGRATGPHLHFEVRLDHRQVDPTQYAGVAHRALNAYQQRAEDTVTEKIGPRGGDEP
jgi:murein DD-endopeptidase MepM/ murein hydrolase activator NlpD